MRAFIGGNLAHKIIDVNFSYNGNLGTLQAGTRMNSETAYALYAEGIISDEEYKEINSEIHQYFVMGLEKAMKSGSSAYMY